MSYSVPGRHLVLQQAMRVVFCDAGITATLEVSYLHPRERTLAQRLQGLPAIAATLVLLVKILKLETGHKEMSHSSVLYQRIDNGRLRER
jgi:hypothetical protein